MFDDLRQQSKARTPRPSPTVDPQSIGSGEEHTLLIILALVAIAISLFIFTLIFVINTSPYWDYSVKCYQQGTLIYSGTLRQAGLGYNSTETGARVILPTDSCIFTEMSK
jgi:hypothetical protein